MLRWLGYFFLGLSEHGWAIFRNFKKNGWRDLSYNQANAFVKSVQLSEDGYLTIPQSEVIPFAEQIVYRTIECRDCLKDSKCPHCECTFPDKMQTPEQHCPQGEWGEVVEKEDWEKYKQDQNIENFSINYYGR